VLFGYQDFYYRCEIAEGGVFDGEVIKLVSKESKDSGVKRAQGRNERARDKTESPIPELNLTK